MSNNMYVVEARNADGSLNLEEGKQPPFHVVSEQQLFDYYFDKNPDEATAAWKPMLDWYASHGWQIRQKYW